MVANAASAKTARDRLLDFVRGEDVTAHLTLAWRPSPGEYRVRLVEIDGTLGQEFLKHARELSEDLANNRTQRDYDPEWPLAEAEFFAIEAGQIPGGDLFPELQHFLDLERFEKGSLPKPRLYTVAIQGPSGTALFGKRMAYLKTLGRRKGIFSAIWDGSTFNELDAVVATFSDTFDWVLWDNTLYVLNGKNFLAEFRDQKALKEAVQEHVNAICQRVRIIGADEFVKRCQSSVSMASKLQKVAEQGIWDQPIETLKTYAEERGIDVEWDGDALVFNGSLDHQHAILKLLDEDRTHGPVSGRTYDSAAKQAVDLGQRAT
jgi:hypothetical protein